MTNGLAYLAGAFGDKENPFLQPRRQDADGALAAVKQMDGFEIYGRPIKVSLVSGNSAQNVLVFENGSPALENR